MAEAELDKRWEEWNLPVEVTLGDLSEQACQIFQLQQSSYQVLDTLKRKYKADKFEISAEVVVARGKRKTIAVDQRLVFETVFGVNLGSSQIDFFADVRPKNTPDSDYKKVRFVYTNKVNPGSPDTVVISRKLAKRMGVTTGERIVISRVYQDMTRVDLDTLTY